MARKLPDIFEDMRQALLGRRDGYNWTSGMGDVYGATLNGLKGFSGDTLAATAARLNEAAPYIEQAGYDMTEIEVGIGLSPKILAHLRLREVISVEAQQALLSKVQSKRLIRTILQSLFQASRAREKLRIREFHFTEIELELSILPTVTLKFKPNADGLALLANGTESKDAESGGAKG